MLTRSEDTWKSFRVLAFQFLGTLICPAMTTNMSVTWQHGHALSTTISSGTSSADQACTSTRTCWFGSKWTLITFFKLGMWGLYSPISLGQARRKFHLKPMESSSEVTWWHASGKDKWWNYICTLNMHGRVSSCDNVTVLYVDLFVLLYCRLG